MKHIIAIFSFFLAGSAIAWQPTKPIESVVGFSAGSGNEVSFRIVASQVEKNTKATFPVILKPGAGSAIANEFVSKEPADGYHMLVGSDSALYATDRMVIPNKKHSLDDFTPVMSYASSPMTIVTQPNDSVNNFQEFVKILKSEKVTMGDPGSGARLVYELLQSNIKFVEGKDGVTRVEYKGPADTLNDVMGGHIRFGIMPLTVSYQAHKAGKVKIIAVTSAKTPDSLLGVTTTSSVYPDLVWNLNWSIMLPKSTSKDIVNWYVIEFNRALADKEVQEKLSANQMFINKSLTNPVAWTAHLYANEKRFTPLVDRVLATQQK